MRQMTWSEWVEENPLKKWMREQEVTQVAVALQVGRTPYAVHMWTRGIIPEQQNAEWFWEQMTKLTGDDKIKKRWYEWAKAQPKISPCREIL
jgi:antirestriction protein